jgi:hypothetical protein
MKARMFVLALLIAMVFVSCEKETITPDLLKAQEVLAMTESQLYQRGWAPRGIPYMDITFSPKSDVCDMPHGFCNDAEMMPNVRLVPVIHTKRNVVVELVKPDKLRFYFSKNYAVPKEDLRERILEDVGSAGLPYVDKIADHISQTFKVPHDMEFHSVDARKILEYYKVEGTGITVLEGVYPIITPKNVPFSNPYFEVDIAIETWEAYADPNVET